ncbi:MAG: DUF4968 domain-containing protein, partial [Bacteroidaceae bacterium]|nr:DUF4968 domain-containing protein [Bacteroidaceae bacterium]
MKVKNTSFCLLAALLLASCGEADVQKLADGIIVNFDQDQPTDVRKIRLQVKGDKLIRVSATPENKFSDRESLIIVPQEEKAPFTVEDAETFVSVVTSEVKAIVDKTTGEVKFTDLEGNVILAENQGGGKTFTPIEVEGKKQYSVRQVFESPADEAFYGLGQHQADEFNYKGKNEELFQYNTKVSVPFIVSNKGYGLLWDSYSLARFGNPDDYKQLGEVFKLYDKEGKEGAITGIYTPDKNRGSEVIVRREDSLYFEHLVRKKLDRVVNLPQKFPYKGANVLYEGSIEPSETGEYKFILYYAGYMKVYIDGELVVPERWRTAWNPNSYKFACKLEAGKKVPLKIEWLPDGDVSYCGLRVMEPFADQSKQSWWSEMNPEIDYYFVAGEDMDEVISGYRTLTGKAQVMPKWAMGYWQSREKYNSMDELLSTFREFRARQIPIDNIVLDWLHWPQDAWGSHEFDPQRFPNPKGMVDEIHDMNGRIMVSVWPKFYQTTEHYKEFDEKGWMYQ